MRLDKTKGGQAIYVKDDIHEQMRIVAPNDGRRPFIEASKTEWVNTRYRTNYLVIQLTMTELVELAEMLDIMIDHDKE